MPLFKHRFLREHPVQSGMVWAAFFGLSFFLVMLFIGIPMKSAVVVMLVLCSIMGGLGWGYSMKAYHERAGNRQ
jgi:hypothetical protein